MRSYFWFILSLVPVVLSAGEEIYANTSIYSNKSEFQSELPSKYS